MPRSKQAADLFGGALFTAGVALAALGANANAQCNPQVTDTVREDPYRAPGNYNFYQFTGADIEGDKLHLMHYSYRSYEPYGYIDSLVTFDISNPSNVTLLGQWEPGVNFRRGGPLANGDTLYIGSPTSNKDVNTYDISDPNNGVPLGSVTLTGFQSGLFEKHNGALLLSTFSPLELVSISLVDPLNPTILDSIPITAGLGGAPRMSLPFDDVIANVRDSDDVLFLFNVGDPANLAPYGTLPLGLTGQNPRVADMAIVGNTLVCYVETNTTAPYLRIVDITDRNSPSIIGSFTPGLGDLKLFRASGMFVFASTDVGSTGTDATYPIDFSNPASPVVGSPINLPTFRQARNAALGDGVLVRTFNDESSDSFVIGADLLDISSCALPPTITSLSPGGAIDEGGAPLQISVLDDNGVLYDWFRDGAPISDDAVYSGSSTPNLTIAGDLSAAGLYTVTVSNGDGQDSAGTAIVAVRGTPAAADGACCLAGGVCAVTTEADCLASAGFYSGDGTDCGSVICSGCIGDINGDGTTDVFDFADFAADFGCTTP